jgi:GT2 family glycosyltransferase
MPENDRPLLSIVCLSFGRPRLLEHALRSLSSQTYPNTELWVVDNRSPHSDEITAMVGAHPKANLLSIFRNRGYTGGMNTGLDNVSGKYVFLTEDDIVAESDCLERLYEYVEQNPQTGLVTGLMLNHGSKTIRSAGGITSLGAHWSKHIVAAGAPDDGKLSEPYFVNYVPGAMIFAETALMRELRGFRRDFFVYCEDDELCLRVTRLGRPIVVVPKSRVAHFEPEEKPESALVTFHKQKNFLALYVLHAPRAVLFEALLRYGVGALAEARRSGANWLVYLRARLWLLANFPRLLLDRWQIRLDCKPTEFGGPR